MKVTALLPDKLVKSVQELSGGATITESLSIALNEWLEIQQIRRLRKAIARKPLRFKASFSAEKIRRLSRRR
jgi:hypothetical protein